MNSVFPIAAVPVFILSGAMQWSISRYFGNSEYAYEQLVTKYSSVVCFACALLFAIMNFFV